MRGQRILRLVSKSLLPILGFFLFFLFWWVFSMILGQSRLPRPHQVIIKFFTLPFFSPEIASWEEGVKNITPHLFFTIRYYLIGTSIGIVSGIAFGLWMGWSRAARNFFELPIEGLRTIPPLAAMPFLLMWVGPTALSEVLLVSIYCFLMLVINTINAIENVPLLYRQFAETLGASKGQIYRTVIVPAIIPELRGGIRVALIRSWGLQVVAELMGSPLGLGKAFTELVPYFAIAAIMAVTLWIILLALTTDRLFLWAVKRWTKWVA